MPAPERTTVLISELAAITSQRAYLPYVWGLLRAHVEYQRPEVWDAVDWLPPLFGARPPDQALAAVEAERVDVLGLSCYTWNWEPQRELARLAKAAHPACLVIAGGPQPDVADADFFRRNPFLDAVVVNDGEIPFGMILERVCAGERDLSQIPGLARPGPDRIPVPGLPPVKPVDFSRSPYVEYASVYEQILREHPGTSIVLETNRGCPYGCSFCDWGSNTLAKIRPFDMQRVEAEARWAFSQPVFMGFLADANFGILPRDVEIAELYASLRHDDRGPRIFYYSPAKNSPDRTSAIAKTFARAGLASSHPVAVQHTDPEVLAATDRANISIEKQREVVRDLTRAGIPLSAQLILGIPGDTVDKWRQVFADLMEWGVHDCWIVSEYALLPNAPAAAPEFREKWGYETLRRATAAHGRSRPKGDLRGTCSVDLIVACRTFTREDWVQMRTYTALVTGLHNTGYTRRIAQYLRFSHGVPYRRFYDQVILDLLRTQFEDGAWWREIEENLRAFLVDPNVSDALDCPGIPQLGLDLRHEDWVLLETASHRDAFFEALSHFLALEHPAATALTSVIEFQKQLVITADYDPGEGRRFHSEHEWSAYFEAIDQLVQHEPRPEPDLASPDQVFEIADTATGVRKQQPFDWCELEDATDRLTAWARCMVRMERSASSQCFDLPRRAPAQRRLRAIIA